jgi:uncharacterized protein YkwD
VSSPQRNVLTPARLLVAALAVAVVAILAFSASPAEAAQCKGGDRAPSALSKDQAERAVLCLINRQRQSRGMGRLDRESSQAKAARKHTKHMIRKRCFSHQCAGEPDLVSRIERTSYLPCNCYWGVGENLAYGERREGTPRGMVQAWMDSPPHRANILNRRYEHIGIGVVWGTPGIGRHRGSATYTTDFGYRD